MQFLFRKKDNLQQTLLHLLRAKTRAFSHIVMALVSIAQNAQCPPLHGCWGLCGTTKVPGCPWTPLVVLPLLWEISWGQMYQGMSHNFISLSKNCSHSEILLNTHVHLTNYQMMFSSSICPSRLYFLQSFS